jgi:DegV family protein with EDD domain
VQDYIIVTDATCDLPVEILRDSDIEVIPMEFIMEDKVYSHYPDERQMAVSEFYNHLKMGRMSTTTQINYNKYKTVFTDILKQGKDVLYICFSSGLSGTYNGSRLVIDDLKEEFPDREIISVDSLSASIGEGLLVYLAALKKQEGFSIDRLKHWIETKRFEICHWFAVDDLEHLRRGGRINAVQASVGSILDLKPILSVDREGKLVTAAKIRGKKKSYRYLIQKLMEDGEKVENETILIGHANCVEDAKNLQQLLLEENLAGKAVICNIGPIIGSHTGAGMLAVTFVGRSRSNA